jgi:SET domain-containing protein
MEVKYCERVCGQALFTLQEFKNGSEVFILKGKIKKRPTKYTIEIGNKQHIIDPCGIYMNHSFNPSTEIVGKYVIALRDIKVGDELNFNYNHSETNMHTPFQTNEGYVAGRVGGSEKSVQFLKCVIV